MTIEKLSDANTDKTTTKILAWISTLDNEDTKNQKLNTRIPGTFDWILNAPELQTWISEQSKSQILWCYGLPGTGKSTLSSIIIDELERLIRRPNQALVYVYSDYYNTITSLDLLLSICRQLASQCPELPWQVVKLYSQTVSGGRRPDIDETMLLNVAMCDSFSEVFIVVDGIDCVAWEWGRETLLEKLQWMCNHGAKVLISSGTHGNRPERCGCLKDIEAALQDETQLLLHPREKDLAVFVEQTLKAQTNWEEMLLVQHISLDKFVRRVTTDCGGVFRVAELQVKRAIRGLKELALSQRGSSLPPDSWEYMLERLARIRQQKNQRKILAWKLLGWVVYAVVPLTITELCHAATCVRISRSEYYSLQFLDRDAIVTFGDKADETYPEETCSIVALCEGLICVSDDQHVKLWVDHQLSEEQKEQIFPHTQRAIALDCLHILSEDSLVAWKHDPRTSTSGNIAPILEYCEMHWGDHYSACPEDYQRETLDRVALVYLRRLHERPARWIETRKPFYDKPYQVLVTDDETPIIKAARFGLDGLLEKLIKSNEYDINAKSWKKETALYVAVTAHRTSTVQTLYRHGASIHFKDKYGKSLLHTAVEEDDEVMALLLANCGLNINTRASDQRDHETPLQVAAAKNSVRCGKFLLEERAETMGALEAAADAGALEFIKLLVEHGCKLSTTGHRDARSTVLGKAISSGSVSLVEYIITSGVNVSELDDRNTTSIHIAARYGNLDIVKALVEHGADPFVTDNGSNEVCEGNCAMSTVVQSGKTEIVQYLLPRLSSTIPSESLLRIATTAVQAKEANMQVLDMILPWIIGIEDYSKKAIQNTLLGAAIGREDGSLVATLLANSIPTETVDENGWTALHLAANRQRADATRILLENGANVNAKSKRGMTPLHIAAYQGYLDIINQLLGYGANISAKAEDGSTPLVAAAYNSKNDAVALLLERNSPMNDSNKNGETVLHHAIQDNDSKLLEILLRYKPDLSIQSWRVGSALHHAAFKGSMDMIERLLTQGADINQGFQYQGDRYQPPEEYGSQEGLPWNRCGIEKKSRSRGKWATIEEGWTPLHSTACGGHLEGVKLLLKHGADVAAKAGSGQTPLHIAASACIPDVVKVLLDHGANISATNSLGETPMHSVASASIAAESTRMANRFKCACTLRHEEEEKHGHQDYSRSDCIRILLESGGDIGARNNLGFTPLTVAVQTSNLDVVHAILSYASLSSEYLPEDDYLRLLQHCGPDVKREVLQIVADVAMETTESRAAWQELLFKACPAKNSALVALALERGAIWPIKSWDAENPFLEAVVNGDLPTVSLLLRAGASPEEADKLGRNALHLACHGRPDSKHNTLFVDLQGNSKFLIVRELLLNGARCNARTPSGDTALHFAVAAGKLDIVRCLIGLGASVDMRNKRGETPLHSAVTTWIFPDIVEHLLRNKACSSAQDLAGYTPLHRIREKRAEGVRAMQLLLSHGCDASIRARNGDMAHHSAFKRGNWKVSKFLMELGMAVNERGFKERTVLHVAVQKRQDDLVGALVKLGADWDIRDNTGRSPRDYMQQLGVDLEGE